jgi:hypothetical protein
MKLCLTHKKSFHRRDQGIPQTDISDCMKAKGIQAGYGIEALFVRKGEQ